MIVLILVWMTWQDPVIYEIQLTGRLGEFQQFALKYEKLEAFGIDGIIKVPVHDPNASFEIVGPMSKVYFIGVWSQYSATKRIEIDVTKPGLALFELVTANRVKQLLMNNPAEVTVIKIEDRPENQVALTSDVLQLNQQVHLQKTNLGGGSPIIRGMSGNRILYLVDGFKVNNGTFRLGLNQYLNTIPVEMIDQVEILGGPSGVQFGSDGLGGAIQFVTKDPVAGGPNQVKLNQYVSTADGTHAETLSFNGGFNTISFNGHIKNSAFKDLRAGEPVRVQTPTGFDQRDGSFSVGWDLSNKKSLVLLNMLSSADDVPRTDRIWSGKDLLWTYDPQRFRLHGLKFRAASPVKIWDNLDSGLAWSSQEEGQNRISVNAPELLENAFTRVDTIQGYVTLTRFFGPGQLVYGADFQSDSVTSHSSVFNLETQIREETAPKFPDDSEYQQVGGYSILMIHPNPHLELRAGLRYSQVQLNGTLVDPLGYQQLKNEKWSPVFSVSSNHGNRFFSFSASSGFRSPNLEDALSIGFSNKGFDAPNPALQPETVWNYDVTFRYRNQKRFFQTTAFFASYNNLIERTPGTYLGAGTFQGEEVFILDNVGTAEVKGLSFSYLEQLNTKWQFNLDSSFIHGFQTTVHQPMTRIPPFRIISGLAYESTFCKFEFRLDYAGKQDRLSPDDLIDTRIPEGGTPSYLAGHIKTSWQVSPRVAFSAAIENLGDVLYKHHGSGVFEPGRRVLLNFRVTNRPVKTNQRGG